VGLLRRFLKIGQFWVVFALATKPQGGQGPWNSQFSFPFTHRCCKPNLVEIPALVPEKKLKMLKSLRTTKDDERKRIAICHLSDSGDLKMLDLGWPNNMSRYEKQTFIVSSTEVPYILR
jgi:hypothetical protein